APGAAVDRRPRPVALGQIPPRRARAQNPENAGLDRPVVLPRSPRLGSRRHERHVHTPLRIPQVMTSSCNNQPATSKTLQLPIPPPLGSGRQERLDHTPLSIPQLMTSSRNNQPSTSRILQLLKPHYVTPEFAYRAESRPPSQDPTPSLHPSRRYPHHRHSAG